MSILPIDVPRALRPLLGPRRYKGAYGGRGGAKSHFYAEQLIARCYAKPTRAVCIREVQNSLKDSVYQLLVDKIGKMGVGSAFDPLKTEIRGKNGSLIIFKGMQEYNSDNIKSLEGFDIAWVEEAQTLSERSFNMLRPTIRNAGSELWFSWNPRYKTDPVDRFFRSQANQEDADIISVSVGWRDNPWLPIELVKEKDRDYAADPALAEHIWGGGYEVVTEGAYFARQLATARLDGRIGPVPHTSGAKVTTAWDIGYGDDTAIWFAQIIGAEPRIIDYYENRGVGIEHYAKILASKPYIYHRHLLPHDGSKGEFISGSTIVASARSLLTGPVEVLPRISVDDGIQAARGLIDKCRFDEVRCTTGLEALRLYRRDYNEKRMAFSDKPLHDWTSHAADAFRYLALGLREPTKRPPPRETAGSWMG